VNLLPQLEQLKIIDTRAHLIDFRLNWAQQEYLAEIERQYEQRRLVRIIVCKARQLGVSTLTEAVMFLWCFIHDNVNGLVIAHENDSAQHLLGMSQTYWETYPYRRAYNPKYRSRNEIAWVETKSSMKISTAKNVNTGRSKTLHVVHASEVAFWDKATMTMGGLEQAFHFEPNTIGVIESTANGVGGYFHDMWYAAEAGETEYKPLFFPWWKHPQYTWGYLNQTLNQPTPVLDNMNEEERVLRRMGVDDDHLLWRRWALRNLVQNDLSLFHSEYPSTADESFVATGYNIFPLADLRACYEPIERPLQGRLLREGATVRFVPDIAGPLRIYQTPSSDYDWGRYMVAGDPTRVTTGDFAAAQVINRRTYRQVATWRGRIDGASFADELAKLGIYYNTALLTCETTGAGYTAMGALIQMNYPHLYKHRFADREPTVIATQYGWDTNQQRKEWMIGFLLKLIVDRTLTIHDKTTFFEMQNYVTMNNGTYGPNSSSGYDDTVTSLAQACICSSTELLEAYTGPVNKVLEPVDSQRTWQAWNEEPAS
jgi:hypothetical protein